MEITIRFAEANDDLKLVVDSESTVGEIKTKIKELLPELENKYLRLIKGGRILIDGQTIKKYFPEQSTLDTSDDETETTKSLQQRFIHCLVTEIEPETENLEPQNEDRLIGFDRLRDAGFEQEEIEEIRRNFHLTHGTDNEQNDVQRLREIEESWMDSRGDEDIPDSNLRTSEYQIFIGLVVGFFGGFIPLFWAWGKHSPFTVREFIGKRERVFGKITSLL
ncbi:hypothetical protein BB558_003178 [Smittium angustum]|uniref:Ubiquitin-like domain-containing protein n=1 Tax=Smittium angustum TaxID=133377 RepID=A0A2U1J6M5_SMIAN|nr:hypothetical protein BB558_003178 [Smittium angustum]